MLIIPKVIVVFWNKGNDEEPLGHLEMPGFRKSKEE